VSKLRDDKVEAKAEHAILSTAAFPSGRKGICVESGIIITAPAHAVQLAKILRAGLLDMHVRGLGQQERAGKTNSLYQYISSGSFAQLLKHLSALTKELQEIGVQEQATHSTVWKRRGKLHIKQRNALTEIDTEIATIIESKLDPAA